MVEKTLQSTVSLDQDSGRDGAAGARAPNTRKYKWIIGVLAVVTVGLAVGLGISLSSNNGRSTETVVFESKWDAEYTAPAHAPGYYLRDLMEGKTFFDHFVFEDAAHFYAGMGRGDPTNGYVHYVNESTAQQLNLVSFTPAGNPRIDVEHKTVVHPDDIGRKSVRLRSKKTWRTGLVIADVLHMPEGKATWPALWTVEGAHWPNLGEIDLIEGCNDMAFTQATVHTGPGCSMENIATPKNMSGPGFIYMNCNAEGGATGCGVQGPHGSFGPPFNAANGGTFALEWTDEYLKTWFFERGQSPIEKDSAQADAPTPWTWGRPFAYWTLASNCPAEKHFGAHVLVINTCLCGDWGGRFWQDECVQHVRDNPDAFLSAYWDINSVRVYQLGERQTPEQTGSE